MPNIVDFKKTQKGLYQPSKNPSIIDVPEMVFIMADGQGDPNTSQSYKAALEALYGISYSIKMSKMGPWQPEGYFDFVVPPLEGLWTFDEQAFEAGSADKNKFQWTSMVRLPEFVTTEVFDAVKAGLAKKKPDVDTSIIRLEKFTEGLCAQILHIGPYDDEPATILLLKEFITQSGYRVDLSGKKRHHEIYLGDPRKVAPEKLKTIIRYPISK
jgi:hypothetical protein